MRICLAAAFILAATGCGMTSDGPATEEVAADTVFLDPAITIGVEEGDPNYLFGSITSVAVDAEGLPGGDFVLVGGLQHNRAEGLHFRLQLTRRGGW